MKITQAKKMSVVQRMFRKGYDDAVISNVFASNGFVRSAFLRWAPREHARLRLQSHHLDRMRRSPGRTRTPPVRARGEPRRHHGRVGRQQQRPGGDLPAAAAAAARLARVPRPRAQRAGEVGVHVRAQEDRVPDVAVEEGQELGALRGVALPAVVRSQVEPLDRDLVDDHLPGGGRAPDRALEAGELSAAEHRPPRVVNGLQAGTRKRLREFAVEGCETVPYRRWRGGRAVRHAGQRVLAAMPGARLRTAERALVEEEELEVPAPAEAAVDPGGGLVMDRHVVAEGPLPGPVESRAELGAGGNVGEIRGVP